MFYGTDREGNMITENKIGGAVNAPHSIDGQRQHSMALAALQALREEAFYFAMKYRYDPALGRAHGDYLNKLNLILMAI